MTTYAYQPPYLIREEEGEGLWTNSILPIFNCYLEDSTWKRHIPDRYAIALAAISDGSILWLVSEPDGYEEINWTEYNALDPGGLSAHDHSGPGEGGDTLNPLSVRFQGGEGSSLILPEVGDEDLSSVAEIGAMITNEGMPVIFLGEGMDWVIPWFGLREYPISYSMSNARFIDGGYYRINESSGANMLKSYEDSLSWRYTEAGEGIISWTDICSISLSGILMIGDITLVTEGATVDGRDLSVDGTKLDTIQGWATVDDHLVLSDPYDEYPGDLYEKIHAGPGIQVDLIDGGYPIGNYLEISSITDRMILDNCTIDDESECHYINPDLPASLAICDGGSFVALAVDASPYDPINWTGIFELTHDSASLSVNLMMEDGLTIDGRDLSIDGAKLDEIEEKADVTDIDNIGTALEGAPYPSVSVIFIVNSGGSFDFVEITEQKIIGRLTGEEIGELSASQVKTLLGVGEASGIASLDASTKVSEDSYYSSRYKELHPLFRTSVVGTWANSADGSQWGCYCNYSNAASKAQNDEIVWNTWLSKGNYDLKILSRTLSQCGIATVYIDGVSQGTIDMYSAGFVYNVIFTLGCVVAATGYQDVKLKMETKNPSASAYMCILTHLSLSQSA